MVRRYLGYLQNEDPLYYIFASRIFQHISDPCFRVEQLTSKQVYKYTEERSGVSVIGKFFDPLDTRIDRLSRLKGEFDNLLRMRNLGFDCPPFYVVAPLTKEESIGLAVAEEYIKGRDLDHYLKKAVFQGANSLLCDRLSFLASFLREIHRRTMTEGQSESSASLNYINSLIEYLSRYSVIHHWDVRSFRTLADKWSDRGMLNNAPNAIIHGDATPTNFIYTSSGSIVAIDLERMRCGDPAYDIGMICGELKHGFLWRTGNIQLAEPFIRHFLKEYVREFEDSRGEFFRLTKRIPFYMALTELRISRNTYLDWAYRRRLAYEARSCLQGGLDD